MSRKVLDQGPGVSPRYALLCWSILLAAFLFRFSDLSLKPPHADEGVNGYFVNQIWEKGFFPYDPTNYHGPLLFYLLQISEKVFGFGIHSFRAVTALFSLLAVWLVLRSRNLPGETTRLFSGLALALSPGMVFFGRSAIHEAVFVFFQILWVIGFLKLREHEERAGLIWFVTGVLGCMLLKETFLVFGLSFLIAWGWTEAFPKISGRSGTKAEVPDRFRPGALDIPFVLTLLALAAVIWLLFYNGFFHNRKGAADFFRALMPWLKTGVGGSGHDKPFYYWTQLLVRYEWAGLAGLAGAFAGAFSRSWKMRFFSLLGLCLWLTYSLIPYKTPWCIISILWPLVIVAGLWTESVLSRGKTGSPSLPIALAVLAVIAVPSAYMSYRLNFLHATDPSEKYVYVQTKDDIRLIDSLLMRKVNELPHLRNMQIEIKLKDHWPLPWLFSRYPNTSYGSVEEPLAPRADVILAEMSVNDQGLAGLYLKRQIELRDARGPLFVYLRQAVFEGLDLSGFAPVKGPEEKGL